MLSDQAPREVPGENVRVTSPGRRGWQGPGRTRKPILARNVRHRHCLLLPANALELRDAASDN
eukprot:scaffold236910_cov41-Prasinocladus_malaysianus.AAC.1